MLQTGDNPKNERQDKDTEVESFYLKVGKYAAAGLEFPSTVLGGLLLGYFLDGYFKTSPWFTAILTIAALIGSFVRLFQWINYFSRRKP
ncbi:MAG: AtpZ/AtpI family protein [Alphaproteobacteria bacterium]